MQRREGNRGGASRRGAVSRWVALPLLPAETPTQHAGTAGSLVGNAIYAQIRAIGIMEVHSEASVIPP